LSCSIYRPPVWIGLADSLSNHPLPGRGRSGEQVTSEMAQSHYIAESADGQARFEPCDRIKSSHIEGVEEFLIPLGHHARLTLSDGVSSPPSTVRSRSSKAHFLIVSHRL